MREKKTVLLITGDCPDVAAGVKLRLQTKGVLSVIVNEHEFLGVGWMFVKERVMTGKRQQRLNGFLENYQGKRRAKEGSNAIPAWVTARAVKGLTNALTRYRPDLTIAFTPNVLKALLKAKESVCPDMPVIAAHTDFVLDFRYAWAQNAVEYFVENIGVKTNLVNAGVAEDIVSIGAFPAPEVVRNTEKPSLFRRSKSALALPFLVVEGREGEEFMRMLPAFEPARTAGRLKIYCDQNRTLFARLHEKGYEVVNEGRTREEMLAEAGLYITYPNGDFIRRAIASGVPTVLSYPMGEFEQRTAEFLRGRITYAETLEDLGGAVEGWLNGATLPRTDNGDNGVAFINRIESELGI